MKIVINTCYGRFDLSEQARSWLGKRGVYLDSVWQISRDLPELVECVETLKHAANGGGARLRIVDIPNDVKWHIAEYEGVEWVAENHRTWGESAADLKEWGDSIAQRKEKP